MTRHTLSQISRPFRQDLLCSKQSLRGKTTYILKDPKTSSYLRLTPSMMALAALCDGKRNLEDIYTHLADKHALSEEDFLTAYTKLHDQQILLPSAAHQNAMLLERRREKRKQRLLTIKGPLLYFRIPIVNPDAFFDRVLPYVRWIWTPTCMTIATGIIIAAVLTLASKWSVFLGSISALSSLHVQHPHVLISLYIVVITTVALHEFGHGLTCKFYGGKVPELGFLFIFFNPCMYCNVSDAWLFPTRRQRLLVTFAGILTEAVIGAICVFVWAFTPAHSFIHIVALQVMCVTGLSSALMNLNPLLRYDGYYALCDSLEIPNLRKRARAYVSHMIKRTLFKDPVPSQEHGLTFQTKSIYLLYGSLSLLYMVSISILILIFIRYGLLWALGEAGHAVWLILAAAYVWKLCHPGVSYIVSRLGSLLRFLRQHILAHPLKIVAQCAGAIAIIVGLGYIPVTTHTHVASSLQYAQTQTLVAPHAGIIQDVDQNPNHQMITLTLVNPNTKEHSTLTTTLGGLTSPADLRQLVGQYVNADDPILTVYDGSAFTSDAVIPSQLHAQLIPNSPVVFIPVGAASPTLLGRLDPLSFQSQGALAQVQIRGLFQDPSSQFRGALPGTLRLTTGSSSLWNTLFGH